MALQDMTGKAPKPLSQQYYERAEELKADGMSNAEAVREIAEQFGKKENAVRGGINQYKRIHLDGGGSASPKRSRRGAKSVDDHLASARLSLEDALGLIDKEVIDAKLALDEAQSRYDAVVVAVKERKADIEGKLKVLS